MRLHRFFVENLNNLLAPQAHGRELVVLLTDRGILHQLRDVFRLGRGDKVIFFDGEGTDVTFRIEMISKEEGIFAKEKEEQSARQGNTRHGSITLLMSLIKKDNFELVLQKCTELGVSRFVPVLAERSEKKNLDIERAKRIIKEAAEQCGRGDIPRLDEIANLEGAIGQYPNIIAFDGSGEMLTAERIFKVLGLASARLGGDGLNQTIENPSGFQLMIGPEGGWSEREIKMFKERNIPIFNLGNLTLRAETAAIAAVSALLLI